MKQLSLHGLFIINHLKVKIMNEKAKNLLAWLATIIGVVMIIVSVVGIVNLVIDTILTSK